MFSLERWSFQSDICSLERRLKLQLAPAHVGKHGCCFSGSNAIWWLCILTYFGEKRNAPNTHIVLLFTNFVPNTRLCVRVQDYSHTRWTLRLTFTVTLESGWVITLICPHCSVSFLNGRANTVDCSRCWWFFSVLLFFSNSMGLNVRATFWQNGQKIEPLNCCFF